MKALIILAFAVLSFGQTTDRKAPEPTARRPPHGPPKPDTWQKSKECAAQTEKVVAGWFKHPDDWQNHYSPKYDKCFVSLCFLSVSSDVKVFRRYSRLC